MSWTVDGKSRRGVLQVALRGTISEDEMEAFVRAHNAAIEAFGSSDYRVFVDLSQMSTLSPQASAAFERAKAFSVGHKNFRRSAVFVADRAVASQQQRTSLASGVRGEFSSDNADLCWAHLALARCSMSLFPLATFEIEEGAVEADYAIMFDAFKPPDARSRHVSLVHTAGLRGMPDAATRRYVAKRQAELDAANGSRSLGTVIIAESALVRGAMTAIQWINAVQTRQHFVATRLEGVQASVVWLEAAQVPVPPSVRAYIRALERNPDASFP